jgi:hypothetical protein
LFKSDDFAAGFFFFAQNAAEVLNKWRSWSRGPVDPELVDPELVDPELVDPHLVDPKPVVPELVDREPHIGSKFSRRFARIV